MKGSSERARSCLKTGLPGMVLKGKKCICYNISK